MKNSLITLLLIIPIHVFAQFSCDYSINNQITFTAAEQAVPHSVTAPNGNTFMAWYSADASTYSVKLQLFDPAGNALWPENLLVSDLPSDTWVTDFSVNVDHEGNCIVAFNDYRNAEYDFDVAVYKVSQTGEFLWGPDGITFVNAGVNDYFPHISVTPENNVILAWTTYNYTVRIQKIASNGTVLWGDPGIELVDPDPAVGYMYPEVVSADEENTFLVWTYQTGNWMYPDKNIYLQKLDLDGNFLYTENVVIYNNNDIPSYAYPNVATDSQDGIYIAWYSFDQGVLNSFVNHADNSGTLTMPVNGVSLQLGTNYLRVMPTMSVDTLTDNVYIYWKQSDTNQTVFGIYGQKLNTLGEKLWGESGIELVPLSNISVTGLTTKPFFDKSVLFTETGLSSGVNSYANAYLIGNDGYTILERTISDYDSEKLDFTYSKISDNRYFIGWTDRRSTQNIFIHGMEAFMINLGADTELYDHESIVLDAGEGLFSYLWNTGSMEQTLLVQADNYDAGLYEFNVTGKDMCDYEYADTIQIQIYNMDNVSENETMQVYLFPNPGNEVLTIHSEQVIHNMDILNTTGQTIESYPDVNGKSSMIDISKFSQGIYFITLFNVSGQRKTIGFIKK